MIFIQAHIFSQQLVILYFLLHFKKHSTFTQHLIILAMHYNQERMNTSLQIILQRLDLLTYWLTYFYGNVHKPQLQSLAAVAGVWHTVACQSFSSLIYSSLFLWCVSSFPGFPWPSILPAALSSDLPPPVLSCPVLHIRCWRSPGHVARLRGGIPPLPPAFMLTSQVVSAFAVRLLTDLLSSSAVRSVGHPQTRFTLQLCSHFVLFACPRLSAPE